MNPSPPSRSPLIFFSGAGLPTWVWDDVRAELADPGTVAPRPSAGSTVSDYAQVALDAAPNGPLTLVAHSSGGLVATELAALAHHRVIGVLAIAAVIPLPNRSFTASLPFPQRLVLPVLLRLIGTKPPEAVIRGSLATGVSENVVERLVQDFTPEPRPYFTTPSRAGVAHVCGYLNTAGDTEVPPPLQVVYAARLNPTARYTLATGHLPMLTEPRALAEAIAAFHDLVDTPSN